jgi:hypothetical protein
MNALGWSLLGSIQTATGRNFGFNEGLDALFSSIGIPPGTLNDRLVDYVRRFNPAITEWNAAMEYLLANQAGAGSIIPTLALDFGATETLDPRITFTRASIGTRVNSNGDMETLQANQPRLDWDPATLRFRGLLHEDGRVNSVPNSTMQGAVVNGALPTGWTTALGTVTATVVGLGTERGVPYIDIRWAGTTNATSTGLRPVSGTTVAASAAQSWTASWSMRIVDGSLTNVTAIRVNIAGLQADGVTLSTDTFSSDVTATVVAATNVFGGRVSTTGLLADALTAFLRLNVLFSHSNGVPIDFTFRFSMPQLELGAFMTSFIPTSSAAVTRQADQAVISGANFSGIFSAFPVSVLASAICPIDTDAVSGSRGVAQISDGTTANRVLLTKTSPLNRAGYTVSNGGVSEAGFTTAAQAWPANDFGIKKIALAVNTDDAAGFFQGSLVGSDVTVNPPAVSQIEVGWAIGQSRGTWLNRIALFPRRLSDAQLQALTA